MRKYNHVTPYVGVWIETFYLKYLTSLFSVTPYVGVWIETTRIWINWKSWRRHSLCGSVD